MGKSIEEKKELLQKIIDKVGKEDILHVYIELKDSPDYYEYWENQELFDMIFSVDELKRFAFRSLDQLPSYYRASKTLRIPNGFELPEVDDALKFLEEMDSSSGLMFEPERHENYKKYSNDEIVMSYAVGKNTDALIMADDNLKKNKNFIISILNRKGPCSNFYELNRCMEEFHSKDKDVILKLLEITKGDARLYWIDDELKRDPDFALEVVQRHGHIGYFSEEIKNNPELMKKCIHFCGNNISALPKTLSEDIEYMRSVLLECGPYKPVIAAYWNGEAYYRVLSDYIPGELKNDPDFMKQFNERKSRKVGYLPEEIADSINPRQGEIDEVMKETAKEASIQEETKIPEGNSSNPGGDKRE